jgi:hypothetical protein
MTLAGAGWKLSFTGRWNKLVLAEAPDANAPSSRHTIAGTNPRLRPI